MYNIKYISNNGKNLNFSLSNNLAITSISGLTENTIELAETQGVAQIGSSIQGKSVQGKDIVINGEIIGTARFLRGQLLDTITPLEGGTLIFNNILELGVEPIMTPYVENYAENSKFQFTLRASYPYWRSIKQIITDVAGLEPKFKFPIDYGNTGNEGHPREHIFGQRISNFFVNVENKGNVPAPFKVMFIAKTQLSNPSITKVSTLEFIKIQKAMISGERIEVDMMGDLPKLTSYKIGSEEDVFRYFDIDSTLFELDVGDNLIRYDADSNRNGLDVKITRADTWSAPYGDDKTYE